MYEPKLEKDLRCPLEYGLKIFGGKWKTRIVCLLSEAQTLRYSALRDKMVTITDAVLASTLKELIADGIVRRQSFDEIPPRVEYSLTEKGLSSIPLLHSICRWATTYHPEFTFLQCQECPYQPVIGAEPSEEP